MNAYSVTHPNGTSLINLPKIAKKNNQKTASLNLWLEPVSIVNKSTTWTPPRRSAQLFQKQNWAQS